MRFKAGLVPAFFFLLTLLRGRIKETNTLAVYYLLG
jgi:hypothetical protein